MANILLLCTLGGSCDPIAASIKHWLPQRIVFVVSPESREHVAGENGVLSICSREGLNVSPGCYDIVEVDDAQDFMSNIRSMKALSIDVEKWLSRGKEYEVVVDFTGGTKCMTAALALAAQRWRCRFSYVGGDERTKDGIGVVVNGKERILNTANPWDALGYQAVEDAVTLFNQRAYYSAKKLLEDAVRDSGDGRVKRQLSTLRSLAQACHDWERFAHGAAMKTLSEVDKNSSDLQALFGPVGASAINKWIDGSLAFLSEIVSKPERSLAFVLDLMANAKRRADEGRYDDAVARLYRATEAFAQAHLAESHNIHSTKKVPLSSIPESLRCKLSGNPEGEHVKMGLQDAYALLHALRDDAGTRFFTLKWNEKTSPLSTRNDSILAHGYTSIRNEVFKSLWKGCLTLMDIDEVELINFIRLPLPV